MFHINQAGTLIWLTAEIRAPHCFSTRQGGVSTGYLSSLNLGIYRGDDPENVAENYRILGSAVGFDPDSLVFTRQTHSAIVRAVDGSNCGEGLLRPVEPECDALITAAPGVTLAVFTADCTPILLHDPVTGAVGAVHAGWRGSVAGIAAKTVEAMQRRYGSRPENIHAAIGPNIGACCFETDSDVPAALRALLGQEAQAFIEERGSKFHVDLKGANRRILELAGVKHIDVSDHCTACRQDLYWSHRRVGASRGSLAAIIQCPKGERL